MLLLPCVVIWCYEQLPGSCCIFLLSFALVFLFGSYSPFGKKIDKKYPEFMCQFYAVNMPALSFFAQNPLRMFLKHTCWPNLFGRSRNFDKYLRFSSSFVIHSPIRMSTNHDRAYFLSCLLEEQSINRWNAVKIAWEQRRKKIGMLKYLRSHGKVQEVIKGNVTIFGWVNTSRKEKRLFFTIRETWSEDKQKKFRIN